MEEQACCTMEASVLMCSGASCGRLAGHMRCPLAGRLRARARRAQALVRGRR